MSLNGKVIIITGASDGLGKSLTKRLIGLDAIVIGIGKTKSKLDILSKELGSQFHGFQADISNPQELDVVYDMILAKFPIVDVLVNNAAIWFEGSVIDHDLNTLQLLVMTNIFGVMGSVYKIFPGMVSRKKGQILNINSTAGVDVCKDWSPYSGTKFAITGYTKGLYEEASEHGIKVMQFHPGGMNTNIFESYKQGYGEYDRMMDKEKIVDILITMLSQPDDMIIDSMVVRKLGKV